MMFSEGFPEADSRWLNKNLWGGQVGARKRRKERVLLYGGIEGEHSRQKRDDYEL